MTAQQINALLDSVSRGSTFYLVGAGGCGVSGLGHLLLDLGFSIHGSDSVENDEIRQLRQRGAVIHVGHDAAQLRAAKPVLVVYSPAVRPDNPELLAAQQAQLPLLRRAALLAALLCRQDGICVAGMHGKTTTSALLAFALDQLGAHPSYAIGALVPQLDRHAQFAPGTDPLRRTWFVVETDESDGTLGLFQPTHSILLNVDAEHLDHYENLEAVCREFARFAGNTRERVVFCADDVRVADLMSTRPDAVSFGFHALAQYRAEILSSDRGGRFAVWHRGVRLGEFEIALLGEKNVSNACAVVALLHQLGFAAGEIAGAIAGFKGASRRQQELFSSGEFRVFDDYGHHPNEIRATLRAFKELGSHRLIVVFQPHRYTRTLHLMDDFVTAFGGADLLFLTDVYAASEPEIAGVNSAVLAESIRRGGQAVEYVPDLPTLEQAVLSALRPGDLVLFLGAGDITKAAHAVARKLPLMKNGGTSRTKHSVENVMHCPTADVKTAQFEALTADLSAGTILRRNEPLAHRTTLRVGGNADFYAEPADEADLAALLRTCAGQAIPFTVVGRGSNLLIKDGGIRGLVICLSHESFSRVQIVGEHLHCGAGAKLKTVSVEARRNGLAGLEFLEGIPGSVGGAMRMNAGAMGSWMFEVVEQVRFMDFDGNVHDRRASEVNVEYRGCPLFRTHIALGAVLHGSPASREVITERSSAFNSKRWKSQPPQPSAGCIFKNPTTVPAGKLIDELGLKGTRKGGAMVSTVHGNFIVNDGNATARDVLELIDFIRKTARERRGIELETEVEIIGE